MLALKSLLPWFSEEQGGAALPSFRKLRSHRAWAGAAGFPRAWPSGGGREKKRLRVAQVWEQPPGRGKELTPREDANAERCWQPHRE